MLTYELVPKASRPGRYAKGRGHCDENNTSMNRQYTPSARDVEREAAAIIAECGYHSVGHDRLVGLAGVMAGRKQNLLAYRLLRHVLGAPQCEPDIRIRARRLLSQLVPAYHLPMINDPRRNHAWDNALRRAIRPGMHVFEIGAGAGTLAMMAARAGAEKVVACESDPVLAEVAKEIIVRNGFDDRITVLGLRSQDVLPDRDLERPSDLLFCDIFSNRLLGFSPLEAIADARKRLLQPGAPVIPRRIALVAALGSFSEYARRCHIERTAGFDFSPFGDFAQPWFTIRCNDANLKLLSRPLESLAFDFTDGPLQDTGRSVVECEIERDGEIDGIAQWIRLDLDGEAMLEAAPAAGEPFYVGITFTPLSRPAAVRSGDRMTVVTSYSPGSVHCWLA